MLTITDEAASLIRALGREVNAAAGSGLRITIDAYHDSLSMALAPGAAPGDTGSRQRNAGVLIAGCR